MNKKCISVLFIIGSISFLVCLTSFFILEEMISYRVYSFGLFLSTCLVLPQSLFDVKHDNNPTVQARRVLVANILGVIFTFICFLICMAKDI